MITSFIFAMLLVSVSGNPWTYINGTISAYVPVLPSPNTQLYSGEFYLKIQMSSKKILFVLTSHDKLLNGQPTGWYLPEAARPYYVLEPHFTIEFASTKGGKAPVDPSSVENFKDDAECTKFLSDTKTKQGYENTKKLSEVNVNEYVAILYVGGPGACFDLPQNKANIKVAEEFWKQGKIVSAICHGSGALVNVTDQNGKSVFFGRKATSFSNAEETAEKIIDFIPFPVETRLRQLGAKYEKSSQMFESHVVVDGQLITGQNPASGHDFGVAILNALNKK